MLCVTGVYLKEIANTDFVILHLNVRRLRVCCSCMLAGIVGEHKSDQKCVGSVTAGAMGVLSPPELTFCVVCCVGVCSTPVLPK